MDHQKILPSQESIRRFHERTVALYEQTQGNRNISRRKEHFTHWDISEYQVNEPAPTNAYFKDTLAHLLSLVAQKSEIVASMRRYVSQWARWLKLGLSTITDFKLCVEASLPSIFSLWMPSARR